MPKSAPVKRSTKSSKRSSTSNAKQIGSILSKPLFIALLFGVIGVALLSRSFAATEGPSYVSTLQPGAHVPNQLLIRFKENVPQDVQDKLANRFGASEKAAIPQIKVKVLKVPDQALEAVQAALAKNPAVEFVEKDYLVEGTAVTPNDPRYGEQPNIARTQTNAAWDINRGSSAVTVAILDSGVNMTHPDLVGKLLPGYDFVNGDADPTDDNGHGTAAAGVAVAATNNATGIAGYCMECKILPVKVMRADNGGSYSTVAQGVVYSADQGAKVINLSLGSFGTTNSSMDAAIKYARDRGAITIASAGNYSRVDPFYPASNPTVIGVASSEASNTTDVLSGYSNSGSYIELAAPGTNLTTAMTGDYRYFSGTSSAAPVVSGIAGLLWSAKPSATIDEIERALVSTGDPITGATSIGGGRVNAYKAITSLTGVTPAPTPPTPPVDTTPPSATITSPASGSVITGQTSVIVDANDNVSVAKVELYRSGTLVSSDNLAPYAFYWDSLTVPNGAYALTARAYDTAGNITLSTAINVTVSNTVVSDTQPPVVTLRSPVSGATVQRQTDIIASATDNVRVVSMEAYVDGKLVGSSTTGNIKLRWNAGAKNVAKGSHSIVVKAYDSAGNAGERSILVTK